MLYEGISLTMNSRVLNGSQRVVMDGVISDAECQELQRLTNVSEASHCTIASAPRARGLFPKRQHSLLPSSHTPQHTHTQLR